MNYTNLTKIATTALKRNKFRAILTMLGIIIGVGSVIAMLSIGESSKQSIREEMSDMGTNMIFVMPGQQRRGGVMMGNSNTKSLTLKDIDALRKEAKNITEVSPQVSTSGQAVNGNNNWPTTIYGVNASYLDIRKYELKDGRIFTEKEIKSLAKVCIVGQTVVENVFNNNVDPIGQTIRFGGIPLKVIGVLKEKGENGMGMDQDDMIIAPYTSVQRRMLAITHIQSIYASAVSEEQSEAAIAEIETILRRQHKLQEGDDDDFEVRSQAEMVEMVSSVTDMLTLLLGAVAGISLLVGGIGIMNIMFVSVTERTKEIGLRMSVGGRGFDILMQFLIEAVLLSILGGIIGIIFGTGLSYLASFALDMPFVIDTQAVALSFLVCSVIGIFFGWYPARKAANLDPIDAIRHE
ncbi:putative ABC transport system permease protein [Draconibacterium orientale]|uniref:Multidrug ABC transporter substrate-binding protein n=1 Tax=Draconibacterium orientale TaxID=1168034 RepID=X5DC97_9BACT|nr:ABC transporter permease [Draconibacterium orientale]AHW58584.1 multidrug ABC transporter substrate-binding protein [Draconibacterium orientale]SET32382.1 putative ABC transport system permease protein [Draconibacterium orientale]